MINYESHDEIFKCCTLGIKETKYYDSQVILGVVELSDTWTTPLQGRLATGDSDDKANFGKLWLTLVNYTLPSGAREPPQVAQ